MRLKVLQMNGGVVVDARTETALPHEAMWVAAYADVAKVLLDRAVVRFHPVILIPANGEGSGIRRRSIWSSDDQPGAFKAISVVPEVSEEFLILAPPESIPQTATWASIIGAFAIDAAEALSDIPEDIGFQSHIDGVLCLRAAMASLLVSAARDQKLINTETVDALKDQIRSDFARNLTNSLQSTSFNRPRAASERYPGLATALDRIVNAATNPGENIRPMCPDMLFETATNILQEHAPQQAAPALGNRPS